MHCSKWSLLPCLFPFAAWATADSTPSPPPGARVKGPDIPAQPLRGDGLASTENGRHGEGGSSQRARLWAVGLQEPVGCSLCPLFPPVVLSLNHVWSCTSSSPLDRFSWLVFLQPRCPLIMVTPARVMTLKRKSHNVTYLWKACQWLAIRLGIKAQFFPPLILILSPLFACLFKHSNHY